ncbi:MAG: branched-chain amino acid aminotransferase [Solirubrobacteraceae bacterium]|nr:branched-chain amino acid aminotransferase [Solirubrobacteraceae bacterium]
MHTVSYRFVSPSARPTASVSPSASGPASVSPPAAAAIPASVSPPAAAATPASAAALPSAIAWVDGQWHEDAAAASVSVLDHGLLYGDGVFEGVRFYAGQPFLLTRHLRRLRDSARCLLLEVPMADSALEAVCQEAIVRYGEPDGYLRLIVTRGPGALGVSPHTCPRPTVILIAAPLNLYPAERLERGVEVITAAVRRAAPDAVPPQIKSLNYLTSVMAAIEARARGAQEALLLNAAGEIAECTADNVFLVHRGVARTPPVSAGGLRGITRDHVIGLLAAAGVEVEEARLVPADAWSADEAFLTGTGAEVVPIAAIDGRTLDAPGPVTRRARALFAASLPGPAAG